MSGFKGGCLCGAVRYESKADPLLAGNCYCEDCRKSSGSGRCSHIGAPRSAVEVTGDVTTYDRPADSGNMVSRSFCPKCGSALFSTNSGNPDLMFVRASSLDDPEVFKPQMSVYASRAPSWEHMDPGLPAFPEMPHGGVPR